MTSTVTETYRDVTYISTDSHVTEPIELYAERVDAEFRDRVPRIETVDGWRTLLVEGLDPRKLMTGVRAARSRSSATATPTTASATSSATASAPR